jgi:tyrosyl-tRNA synthetase
MYGKLMSISDELMGRYYDLLSTDTGWRDAVRTGRLTPMEAKKALAHRIVARFHGAVPAERAAHFFAQRFQHRTAFEPTPVRLDSAADDIWICQLIKDAHFARSTSEARRLVAQGAVRVDGTPVDVNFRFRRDVHRLLEVGRRRLAEVFFAPREPT